MWRGYNAIPHLLRSGKPMYSNATVNHSKNFLNPVNPDIQHKTLKDCGDLQNSETKNRAGLIDNI